MDIAELLKKVRKIEIKTKGLSSDLFAGEYHSAFKGRGMSFSEVREYQYGDDIRAIDWNVTARFNHPYIKIFEEERELTVMLLIDMSGSSFFGTRREMKNQLVAEICAVLALAAINNNDKVGAILFTDNIELYIPPAKGRPHMLRIIRELLGFERKNKKTDVAEALRFFNGAVKKKSIAFLLSDFISPDYAKPLRITARKHDLVGIRVYDKREAELPDIGMVRMVDAETGAVRWIDSSDGRIRKAWSDEYRATEVNFRRNFLQSGADVISINSEQSYVKALHQFFNRRGARK